MEFKGDYARTRACDSKTSPNSDFWAFFAWFGYVNNISTSLTFGAPSKLGGKRSSSHEISSHNMLER